MAFPRQHWFESSNATPADVICGHRLKIPYHFRSKLPMIFAKFCASRVAVDFIRVWKDVWLCFSTGSTSFPVKRLLCQIKWQYIVCQRQNARPAMEYMQPLRPDHVHLKRFFEVVGVDHAGPLLIKNGGKACILFLSLLQPSKQYTCTL